MKVRILSLTFIAISLCVHTAHADDGEIKNKKTIREVSPDGSQDILIQQERSMKVEQDTHRGNKPNDDKNEDITIKEQGTDKYEGQKNGVKIDGRAKFERETQLSND